MYNGLSNGEAATVYLDTTVPSACHDERTRYRQELTQQFWTERLTAYRPPVSVVVLREIHDTPDPDRRAKIESPVRGFDVLSLSEEAEALAMEYVGRGVFPERYLSDARHVAIASANGLPYLASWNFRHLVKVNTRREINLVNALLGYASIEIAAPPEL